MTLRAYILLLLLYTSCFLLGVVIGLSHASQGCEKQIEYELELDRIEGRQV